MCKCPLRKNFRRISRHSLGFPQTRIETHVQINDDRQVIWSNIRSQIATCYAQVRWNQCISPNSRHVTCLLYSGDSTLGWQSMCLITIWSPYDRLYGFTAIWHIIKDSICATHTPASYNSVMSEPIHPTHIHVIKHILKPLRAHTHALHETCYVIIL